MAPLAVPHHFLRVSPLCNNLFLHDFMGIEGEKKRCVSYVKQVALAETWGGLCASPLPRPPTLPLPHPHSPPSRFLTLWSGLPWVRRPGWALITGRRSLWFDFCRRCSAERFALQLQKKKPLYGGKAEGMLIPQQPLWPLCQDGKWRANYIYSAGSPPKIRRLLPRRAAHDV